MSNHDSDQFGLFPRIIGAVFGLTFGGIGLTLLISLWSVPFHSFHSPPMFFRITGSLMSLPFIAIGLGTLYQIIAGKPVSPARR
ncbi:MAG: hypothetical protein KDA78_12275, partial [Planctomycetaceae bacterium]|nr:hypothetical protein [Planctomycetaceae bacterium]